MREYELTVVYDLAVAEAGGPDASVEQLTTTVETRGGKMLRVDHWGRRRMAYPINRIVDADYIVSRIELEPGDVAPLEATLRINEKVLRHLIVRADELPVPVPPREPRQMPGQVADVTGVPEVPATAADAAALGASGASPEPVPAAPGEDTAEGEAPASGTIAPEAEASSEPIDLTSDEVTPNPEPVGEEVLPTESEPLETTATQAAESAPLAADELAADLDSANPDAGAEPTA
jgi:small subunit ribosomal protein S6